MHRGPSLVRAGDLPPRSSNRALRHVVRVELTKPAAESLSGRTRPPRQAEANASLGLSRARDQRCDEVWFQMVDEFRIELLKVRLRTRATSWDVRGLGTVSELA